MDTIREDNLDGNSLNPDNDQYTDDRKPSANDIDVAESDGGGSSSISSSGMSEKKESDIEIALEHMVNACSILYEYLDTKRCGDEECSTSLSPSSTDNNGSYFLWASEQLSRVLVGIGYVLSYQKKYADALNSYFNAIPYREQLLESVTSSQKNDNDRTKKTSEESALEQLKAHRLLVEVYILIVEEILKCPTGKDITIAETDDVLIKDGERIKMANVYYERAREELQEV